MQLPAAVTFRARSTLAELLQRAICGTAPTMLADDADPVRSCHECATLPVSGSQTDTVDGRPLPAGGGQTTLQLHRAPS